MDSIKQIRTYSEIVRILNEQLKAKKNENEIRFRGNGAFTLSLGILILASGIAFPIFVFTHPQAQELTNLGIINTMLIASVLTIFSFGAFFNDEAQVYLKAAWYWARNKNPETS